MIPFALKNDRGFFKMFAGEEKHTNVKMISGVSPAFNVVLSDDGKKVLGATTLGDSADKFASLPAPFNDPYYLYPQYDKFVEWNKFVQKDVLSEKDPGALFVAGKSAANEGTINGAAQMRQKLKRLYLARILRCSFITPICATWRRKRSEPTTKHGMISSFRLQAKMPTVR